MRISQLLVAVAALAMALAAAEDIPSPPSSPQPTTPPSGGDAGPTNTPSPSQPMNAPEDKPVTIAVPSCNETKLSIFESKAEAMCLDSNKTFPFLPPVNEPTSLTVNVTPTPNPPKQELVIKKAANTKLTLIKFVGRDDINWMLEFQDDAFAAVVNLDTLFFERVNFRNPRILLEGVSTLRSLNLRKTNAQDVSLLGNSSLQEVDFSDTTFPQLPTLFFERKYSPQLKILKPLNISSTKPQKLNQDQLQNLLNNVNLTQAGIVVRNECSEDGGFSICPSETSSSGGGVGSAGVTTPKPTTRAKSSSSTTLIVVVVIVSAVAVVLAAVVTRRYVSRGKLNRSASNNEVFIAKGDVTPHGGKLSFISSDETLRQFRLDQNDVSLTRAVGSGRLWIGELAGQKVIIKRIEAESNDSYATKALRKQAKLLATLDCPSIVRVTGVTWIQGTDFGIVAEYMEKGTVKAVLMDRETPLDVERRISMCLDIAIALSYLHAPGRDMYMRRLSSRKVVVGASLECKLNLFECFPVTNKLDVPDVFGSGDMAWYAPELITRTAPQDARKANIFSLGVLMCEILTGKSPYQSEIDAMGATLADMALLQRIRNKEPLAPHEECPEFLHLRSELRELIARCLSYQPFDRPSADDIVQSLEHLNQRMWQTSL
ncbi:hypothetical protein PINS_up014178 [Pythium insidiosum]|nr:hypothetical protein PINS_up014178 [Pythium insidiosum]